jgi:hypothetical protein
MESQELFERIKHLPPESLAKVEDLVNSLSDGSPSPALDRDSLHDEIAAYAERYAGTEFDLDEELEAAGIEHILETTKW